MSMTDKSRFVNITWGGQDQNTVTLEATATTSDAVNVEFVKMATLYVSWTPGAASRTLEYTIEVNPYPVSYDNDGAEITYDEYWSQVGIYVNTTGDWDEEPAAYISGTSADTSQTMLTPLIIPQIDAARLRVTALESTADEDGGTAEFILVKNTVN